jgi:cytochrome c oxidase subunit 5b
MPTDLEQATGLERLEILGKMQGVDIFDLSPLDASRKGTYNLVERGWTSVFVPAGGCAV